MGVLGQILKEQGLDADVSSDAVNMYRRGLGPDPEVLPINLQPFARLFGHAYVSSKIRAVMDIITGVPEGQKVLVFVCGSAVFPDLSHVCLPSAALGTRWICWRSTQRN